MTSPATAAGVPGTHGDPDLSHVLADFVAKVSPKLDDEERAQLATVLHKTFALEALIDKAGPAEPSARPTRSPPAAPAQRRLWRDPRPEVRVSHTHPEGPPESRYAARHQRADDATQRM